MAKGDKITRTFEALFLREEMGLGTYPSSAIVLDEEFDSRRWYTVRRVVFFHGDAFWEVFYNKPATEMQEGQDMFDDASDVKATQVKPQMVSAVTFVPVLSSR
jgi:hypothetical protein